MKKWTLVAVTFLLIVGGIYLGSPYYAIYSVRNAAVEADTDKLDASVDFPSVRESMKSQLSASLMTHMQSDPNMRNNPFAGLGALMAPAIVDRAVDTFVTADGIAAMVRGQKPNQTAEVKENPDIEWSSEYLSADRFRVRLRNAKLNQDGPSLLFERRGFASWKLIRVKLPPELLDPKSKGSFGAVRGKDLGATANAEKSILENPQTALASSESNAADACLRKWAHFPSDKGSGANAIMIWLREDGTYDYQSGDALNDEHQRGPYSNEDAGGKNSGPAWVFQTGSGTRASIHSCTASKADVGLFYPASGYRDELKLVPFDGDLIEELQRRGYDRTPS